MKKIAAHYHEIDPLIDRIPLQNINPSIKKIPRALRQLIPRTPKMHIGNM